MSVIRYEFKRDVIAGCYCEYLPSDSGGYVSIDDYEKLERQVKRLETVLSTYGIWVKPEGDV